MVVVKNGRMQLRNVDVFRLGTTWLLRMVDAVAVPNIQRELALILEKKLP
jgi:hypothetical protein